MCSELYDGRRVYALQVIRRLEARTRPIRASSRGAGPPEAR